MRFSSISQNVLLLVAGATLMSPGASAQDKARPKKSGGGFLFAQEAFGTYDEGTAEQSLGPSASVTLAGILRDRFGATGRETLKAAKHKNRLIKDAQGRKHIRFEQEYDGLPVVDAAMVMHVDENGQVYAINGEFVAEGSVDTKERVSCDKAYANVLDDSEYQGDAKWLSTCQKKIVFDKFGVAHKAWERMIGFQPPDAGPYQRTLLYASVVTGGIVAVRPQVKGALSLNTKDCKNTEYDCKTVSKSPKKISTGDKAVDKAHNYARATYNYFFNNFGRDSLDDNGMTIVSNTHFSRSFNGAVYSNGQMYYGDGDGIMFGPLSRDADVVAHELTHGVTEFTSNLIYFRESGAVNEAMSDIFGACVDRQEGASVTGTWLVGENIYTPGISGDALRYMANPTQSNISDTDYFPERYTGEADYGGVHWNSGIMNLAFVLMVQGGSHPRSKTDVVVPAIDGDFDKSLLAAAKILYLANTACLTPMSGFFHARQCTILHAGEHKASVEAAWDAVGVSPLPLEFGVPVTGLAAEKGMLVDFIPIIVQAGTTVSCSIDGDNGDADLFIRMVVDAYTSSSCTSESFASTESCSVGPITYGQSTVFVSIKAFDMFTGLTVNCTEVYAPSFIELEDGVPMAGQGAKPGDGFTFVLADIKPLTTVRCEFDVESGAPEVFASVESTSGLSFDFCLLAGPIFGTDFVQKRGSCLLGPQTETVTLYVDMFSYEEVFRNFTLTCFLEPLSLVTLSNWVPYKDNDLQVYNSGFTYSMRRFYRLNDAVETNEQITCLASGNDIETYNYDMTVQYGNLSDFTADVISSCNRQSTIAECTSEPAPATMGAYVEVRIFLRADYGDDAVYDDYFAPTIEGNHSMEIICGIESPAFDLKSGVALANLSGQAGGETALKLYQLEGVRKRDKVTCKIRGGEGSAVLYMKAGGHPYPISDQNACGNNGTRCTIQSVRSDTKVYAALHAVADYSDVSIKCRKSSPCKSRGSKCRRSAQCCGSKSTCDGPNRRKRKCKRGVGAGGNCKRNSQCIRRFNCKKGKCT